MSQTLFTAAERRDFLTRGFSRRDLGRLAGMLAAGASLPFFNESSMAQGLSAMRDIPADATMLSSNENPMGPCPEAQAAIHDVVAKGGRYLYRETFRLIDTLAEVEGLPKTHIQAGAGSSDLLHRAVLAFCSPTRSLIVADPGYEADEKAATSMGAKAIRVLLRKDAFHDVQAMASSHQRVRSRCHACDRDGRRDRQSENKGARRIAKEDHHRGSGRYDRMARSQGICGDAIGEQQDHGRRQATRARCLRGLVQGKGRDWADLALNAQPRSSFNRYSRVNGHFPGGIQQGHGVSLGAT